MGEREKRERAELLFEAMSGIDEELLLRSEAKQKKSRVVVFRRWAETAAACLALFVVGALSFHALMHSKNSMTQEQYISDLARNEMAFSGGGSSPETMEDGMMAEEAAMESDEANVEDLFDRSQELLLTEGPEKEEQKELIPATQGSSAVEEYRTSFESLSDMRELEVVGTLFPAVLPETVVYEEGYCVADAASNSINFAQCFLKVEGHTLRYTIEREDTHQRDDGVYLLAKPDGREWIEYLEPQREELEAGSAVHILYENGCVVSLYGGVSPELLEQLLP